MKQLRELRKSRGKTQADIAEYLGITRAAYTNIENEKRQPDRFTLQRLADYYSVSVDYLLGRVNDQTHPTPANIYPIESRVMRPIVGSVRAGWNGNAEAEYDGELPAYDLKNPEQYVWLRIKGDSMEPEMFEGDFALVHLQNTAQNGDYAVVIVNGDEGTVKRFHSQDGDILLEPINRKYSSMFFSRERAKEVYIYGVVREIKRKYR